MLALELSRLQAWAALPPADANSLLLEPELQDAMNWASQQPLPTQNEVLAALPKLLPTMHPTKASAVLVLAGGLVEDGADPEVLLPAALGHLQRLRAQHEAGESVPAGAWKFTVMGLMAMLTRSRRNRQLLQAQPELLAWLSEHEELSDHFYYLQHIAATSDEAALWVIFPTYGTGLEVDVEQLNNTFHLLTLLQPLVREHAAALGLRRPPGLTNPAILAYACGETYDSPVDSDYTRLEWLTADADAYAGPGRDLHHASVAWGEASVSTGLPRLRGHVLLLADDPAKHIQRSWDAGFLTAMHDANRAAVRLRRLLPPAEVQEILAELATALQVPAEESPRALPPAVAAAPTSHPKPSFWRRLLGG